MQGKSGELHYSFLRNTPIPRKHLKKTKYIGKRICKEAEEKDPFAIIPCVLPLK